MIYLINKVCVNKIYWILNDFKFNIVINYKMEFYRKDFFKLFNKYYKIFKKTKIFYKLKIKHLQFKQFNLKIIKNNYKQIKYVILFN